MTYFGNPSDAFLVNDPSTISLRLPRRKNLEKWIKTVVKLS